ncbi:dephospho-CoA kinase [Bifidobacterium felsineum]|uniref:Dephospho-CoA kinase n=1 Tax=Bifidobacterium felsineum TaxID=2045440 RepID=A0A2M9HKW9_9BIFI|nr:dephospho-CoA kinase [Bifidobacterium felsineum]MBT1164697.1 dephospho-CoA kinase [Bifidobacterium felsineum]PJM77466.1 dephospho-CoA kinase [Bifidobacterium felsineum]
MRIGLTGGIAAGKSTVSARFAELGAVIIDYDALAHRIVEPGGEAIARIAETFGPDALLADGTLNRSWMADHVFGAHGKPGARERLDAIEHPLIYRLAAQQEQSCAPSDIIIHDVPLLAEVIDSIPFRFDHIITVEAPVCMRLDRMIEERGMSLEQAEGRIRHQSSESERRAIADMVIDSAQPMTKMMAQVEEIYQYLLEQTHTPA